MHFRPHHKKEKSVYTKGRLLEKMSVFIGPRYLVRSMGPVVCQLLRPTPFDYLTDNANRAIQGNQAMHVT